MPSFDPWSSSLTSFKTLLSGLGSVQDFLGVEDGDEAATEAAASIYEHEGEEDSTLPLIIITLAPGNTLSVATVDGMVLQSAGAFSVRLVAEPSDETDMAAMYAALGAIAVETCQASAQSPLADVPAITGATLVSLTLASEKGGRPDGALWIGDLSFSWGMGE